MFSKQTKDTLRYTTVALPTAQQGAATRCSMAAVRERQTQPDTYTSHNRATPPAAASMLGLCDAPSPTSKGGSSLPIASVLAFRMVTSMIWGPMIRLAVLLI